MQELKNGEFGPIMESQDLLEKMLCDEDDFLRTKALHFGTIEELEAVKKESQICIKMEELEDRIEAFETLQKPKKGRPILMGESYPGNKEDKEICGILWNKVQKNNH